MNIAMFTNTYSPHVGGVARSVASFCEAYRRKGHRTLVVAPEFPGTPTQETGIVRIPAIQNFNGSDFSVVLPFSGMLSEKMNAFRPDIIHATTLTCSALPPCALHVTVSCPWSLLTIPVMKNTPITFPGTLHE